MARVTKTKASFLLRGRMISDTKGFTSFHRKDDGALVVRNSGFGHSAMRMTAKQVTAFRKWLEESES